MARNPADQAVRVGAQPRPQDGVRDDPPEDVGIHFDLPLDLEGFSDPATDQLRAHVSEFAKALVLEAARVEVAYRADGADTAEVTRTMVIKANEVVRRPPSSTDLPRSPRSVIIYGVTLAATLGAGQMGAYLHSWWQITLCCVIALAAVASGAYVFRRRL